MSDCFDHAADAYDDLCFGRTSDEGIGHNRYGGEPLGKTCKFCGTPYLHWHQVNGKWRLCKKGKPHDCNPITPDAKYTSQREIIRHDAMFSVNLSETVK